jgi:hypothetical protein
MVRYRNIHGLGPEQQDEHGFDVTQHKPLGKPGRELLKREQRHMVARKTSRGRRVYPKVGETGLLDEPTRNVFDKEFPDRPLFEVAFKQIAYQDDKLDGEEYYTQGSARWAGVTAVLGKVKVTRGAPRLKSGDCSAGYTRWVLWGLQQHLGRIPHDIVNGTNWTAGYTGTISVVCKRVYAPRIGDAILYGSGTFSHVTGVYDVAQRLCISHGRDKAEIVDFDRHPNRAGFWRPEYTNA